MGGGLLNSQSYAPLIIYKATRFETEWTKPASSTAASGQTVSTLDSVSQAGRMTPAVLNEYVDNIIVPSHLSLFDFLKSDP